MKTIYVYRVHRWNPFTRRQYQTLREDCGEENVFLIFDDTEQPFDDAMFPTSRYSDTIRDKSAHVFLMNYEECRRVNPLHKSNKEQVESQVIIFKRLCPIAFDYMWLIEYDVVCDGNWSLTFQKCNHLDDDLLSTCMNEFPNEIQWGLWFKIYSRMRSWRPPIHERVKCFFPVNRFSMKFLDELERNMGIYSGFCEVYFPTLAKAKQCTFQNLPKDMLGTVFLYSPDKNFKVTFRNQNRLYHPIISLDDIVQDSSSDD